MILLSVSVSFFSSPLFLLWVSTSGGEKTRSKEGLGAECCTGRNIDEASVLRNY